MPFCVSNSATATANGFSRRDSFLYATSDLHVKYLVAAAEEFDQVLHVRVDAVLRFEFSDGNGEWLLAAEQLFVRHFRSAREVPGRGGGGIRSGTSRAG